MPANLSALEALGLALGTATKTSDTTYKSRSTVRFMKCQRLLKARREDAEGKAKSGAGGSDEQ